MRLNQTDLKDTIKIGLSLVYEYSNPVTQYNWKIEVAKKSKEICITYRDNDNIGYIKLKTIKEATDHCNLIINDFMNHSNQLLNNGQSPEECDAREDQSNSKDGNIKQSKP